jgi:cellobiose-specific phosphotransferase system component IIA
MHFIKKKLPLKSSEANNNSLEADSLLMHSQDNLGVAKQLVSELAATR